MGPWRLFARRAGAACLVASIAFGASALAAGVAGEPAPDDSAVWQKVRQSLFQGRPIATDGAAVLRLDAPSRAEDAATVPITIHAQVEQSPTRFIDKLYLVIDHNPSPVAAVFHFSERSGRADIETRVRIEEYTHLRAIAEMNDGSLFMVTRWVKASGGCSAPAGKDAVAALANVGRMKMRLDDRVANGQPVQAQLMISHPNSSGLAMDQVTRLYEPPYFVRKVSVTYAGRPVMDADVDFSISENPNFRFFFTPDGPGELEAKVVDSRDLTFSDRIAVRPATSGTPARAP